MNNKNFFAVFLLVTGFVNVYSVIPRTVEEAATQKRMMDDGMMMTMEEPETMRVEQKAPTAKFRDCTGLECLVKPPYPVHPLPAGFGEYTDFEGV